MSINEKQFSAICLLTILDHHGAGYFEAHPSYVEEKLSMLNYGYEAYGHLDRPNQLKVIDYLNKWKIIMPEKIRDYENNII